MEHRPFPAETRAWPLAVAPERPLEVVAIVEGWRLVLFSSLACAVLATGYALLRPPAFESRVQLLVENQAFELFRDEPAVVPALIGPTQLESQVRLIGSRGLAREVVNALALVADPEFAPRRRLGVLPPLAVDPDERERAAVAIFLKHLDVGSLGLSSVIEIGFTAPDRDKAARIAEAVAEAYLRRLDRAAESHGDGASPWVRDRLRALGIRATVISDAAASVVPVGPRGALLVPAAAVAGLLLGVALAILRRLFDWNARSPQEVAALIGGEFFGRLPLGAPLVDAPALAQVEAALEEWRQGRGIVAGLASLTAAEEASTVTAALARRLARHGHGVILVDANAALTRRHHLAGEPGLFELLRGAADEAVHIVSDPESDFDILPLGDAPAGEALLHLPAFAHLVARLRGSYDHVLVDLPPILAGAGARAAAGWLDGLVVIAAGPPRLRAELQVAATRLGRTRERLLGVVVTTTG